LGTLWTWVAIGVGGGLGAMARFLVARQMSVMPGNYLPYGTLTVNAVGSWLLGFLAVSLVDRSEISVALRFGITVGFLGAFTTFSAFSYESVVLLQEGAFGRALLNMSMNLVLCVTLCYVGIQMARG